MGRSDAFYSVADVELLMEMIEGNPKELSWYDSGHRLPQEYIAKALQWFEGYLK